MFVEKYLAVLIGEEGSQFWPFYDGKEAVDQICLRIFTALSLSDQIDHMLEQPLTVSLSENGSPPLELLAVLRVIGVEGEQLEVYS